MNIKNCHNKKVSEYRPSPVRDTLCADSTLRTFVDLLREAGVILSFS